MERLLRSTAAQITVTVTSAGEPAEAEGKVTVAIVRENGEALAEGEATKGSDPGVYFYALTPAQTASVDVLKATWTAKVGGVSNQLFVTYHEVVGGYLTSLKAIEESLPNGTSASATELAAARTLAEDWLEDACGVAFRPRYASEQLDGNGTNRVLLSQPMVIAVRSCEVGGQEATVDEVYGAGVLYREEGWLEGARNVAVVYEHGYEQVPTQASRAATKLARHFLVADPSDYDERSTSMTTDTAHYNFITPGISGALTSIPEVNVVIQQFQFGGIA